jgi:glutathione S-transferase
MTLKLFYSPGACSLAPHIVLEEIGTEWEPVRISLKEGAQRRPEYLAINPKGRVPALATDQGVITENPAILAFLAQTFPQANIAPVSDPFGMAQVNSFNGFLSSSLHPAFAHAFRPERFGEGEEAARAMRSRAPVAVAEYLQLAEEKLGGNEWIHGDYTVSDPYLFVFTGWAPRLSVDMTAFPKLQSHRERMMQRPAVKAALAREESATG